MVNIHFPSPIGTNIAVLPSTTTTITGWRQETWYSIITFLCLSHPFLGGRLPWKIIVRICFLDSLSNSITLKTNSLNFQW